MLCCAMALTVHVRMLRPGDEEGPLDLFKSPVGNIAMVPVLLARTRDRSGHRSAPCGQSSITRLR